MFLRLDGRIPSKKNSKFIVTNKRTGYSMPLSKKEYTDWERWAVMELRIQANKWPGKNKFSCCDIVMGITFPDNRKTDLSNKIEGVNDALVKAGIIEDDCWQVVRSLNVSQVDGPTPGVSIEIVERKK